jgi:hypothetical protein
VIPLEDEVGCLDASAEASRHSLFLLPFPFFPKAIHIAFHLKRNKIFRSTQMSEQDIYRQFGEALSAFDREGDTARTRELTRKAIEDAFDAGFSGKEIEAIHTQVYIKSEAADDPEFRNLQDFAEK